MSYYDIDCNRYKILYKKYLKSSTEDILLAGGDIKNKDIIDIGAGTMRLSEKAMKLRCGKILAIEEAMSMVPAKYYYSISNPGKLRLYCHSVGYIVGDVEACRSKYDFAFCQQGINYWFCEKVISGISKHLLKPGGKLIFNTFNTRPNTNPTVKKYKIGNIEYCEVYQLVGSMVHHLQMCNKTAPHFTKFKWISPENFDKILNKIFKKVEVKDKGKTSIYICEA